MQFWCGSRESVLVCWAGDGGLVFEGEVGSGIEAEPSVRTSIQMPNNKSKRRWYNFSLGLLILGIPRTDPAGLYRIAPTGLTKDSD